MSVQKLFENHLLNNKIVLYMKGSPKEPKCGYSWTVSSILEELNVSYFSYDILSDPDMRFFLVNNSDWPTFPQLYVKGELIGGCDILKELYNNGELLGVLNK